MSILSQDIVDFLNEGNGSGLGEWLQDNPLLGHYVTCPCISVRPTAIPKAQRIVVFEDMRGRYIDVQYRDGSHRYIVNVQSRQVTVESLEDLIETVEAAGGTCHLERTFVILSVPASYHICFDDAPPGLFRLARDEHEDIGLSLDELV